MDNSSFIKNTFEPKEGCLLFLSFSFRQPYYYRIFQWKKKSFICLLSSESWTKFEAVTWNNIFQISASLICLNKQNWYLNHQYCFKSTVYKKTKSDQWMYLDKCVSSFQFLCFILLISLFILHLLLTIFSMTIYHL